MLNFKYQDGIYNEDYNWLLDIKLSNCICKHVMSLQTDKAKSVYMESKKIGYDNVMWGYRSKIWKEEEHNRIVQLFNITKMIYKGFIMVLVE